MIILKQSTNLITLTNLEFYLETSLLNGEDRLAPFQPKVKIITQPNSMIALKNTNLNNIILKEEA